MEQLTFAKCLARWLSRPITRHTICKCFIHVLLLKVKLVKKITLKWCWCHWITIFKNSVLNTKKPPILLKLKKGLLINLNILNLICLLNLNMKKPKPMLLLMLNFQIVFVPMVTIQKRLLTISNLLNWCHTRFWILWNAALKEIIKLGAIRWLQTRKRLVILRLRMCRLN